MAPNKAKLRLYLGAAPGVGKTFAMLDEGERRAQRGTDVVIGIVETHGRPKTAAQIKNLEIIPRKKVIYKGQSFEEMDIDAILERKPQVCLVDELAHTNIPGSRNKKRWQDVEELRNAGIEVISTLNIQHLESLNDVVKAITGIEQNETIPDSVARAAEQIELVDMSPQALRRRMAHGNVYPAETVDTALANYFREGNLSALRELALLWVADRVDEALNDYMKAHGISGTWETRERVVVALTGAEGGDNLIRRASRMAVRAKGDLIGVHVISDDGLLRQPPKYLEEQRQLLEELNGKFQQITATDPGQALIDFALAQRATRLVLGSSKRSRWYELLHGSVINKVIRDSQGIDIHIISSGDANQNDQDRSQSIIKNLRIVPSRKLLIPLSLGFIGPIILTAIISAFGSAISLNSALLLYILIAVAVASLGGVANALLSALLAFLLANYFLMPPKDQFKSLSQTDFITFITFIVVAGIVATLMDLVSQRSANATRYGFEAESLVRLSNTLLASPDPLPVLMNELRETFGLSGASLLKPNNNEWIIEASSGDIVPKTPQEAQESVELPDGSLVALAGSKLLSGQDQRLLHAFCTQVGVAMRSRQLQATASHADALSDANNLRTALLAAVSHDLRTPLASIKTAVSSLLQEDLEWSADTQKELLETINTQADRLNSLVGNLLDMSRLQADVLKVQLRPVGLDEVVPAALSSLVDRNKDIRIEVDETLPRVAADPTLLERALANIIDNALAWSPPNSPVWIQAGAFGNTVDLRIVDKGPGIPASEKNNVFQPFQRRGDSSTIGGVGLGLAVAKGFITAMGAQLTVEDTPGGGTTMVVTLPQA